MNTPEPFFKTSRSKSNLDLNSIYYKYLNNQSFRGFYYDSDEKSYGIVLEFGKYLNGRINLFAQMAKGNMNIIEYQILCDTYSFDTIAYDKILINSSNYKSSLLIPREGQIDLPKNLEFSVQILTRNSVYLKFMNSEKYTAPINSFKGGLVLAREHRPLNEQAETATVERDILTY